MSEAVERLLLDIFRAQGLKNPARAAKKAAEAFDMQKRDERVYEANGTTEEKAAAFGLSTRRIEQIVRDERLSRKKIA